MGNNIKKKYPGNPAEEGIKAAKKDAADEAIIERNRELLCTLDDCILEINRNDIEHPKFHDVISEIQSSVNDIGEILSIEGLA